MQLSVCPKSVDEPYFDTKLSKQLSDVCSLRGGLVFDIIRPCTGLDCRLLGVHSVSVRPSGGGEIGRRRRPVGGLSGAAV